MKNMLVVHRARTPKFGLGTRACSIVVAGVLILACGLASAIDFSGVGNTLKSVGGSVGLPIGGGKTGINGDQVGNALKLGGALVKAVDNELGPVEEFYLGREVGARLLASYPQHLPQESPVTQYVTKVGVTLALGSRMPYPYRPYTFVVLETSEMNAFAAPGGIIFITTGLLKFLQNEDELAGVLGHEISHIELRHGVKALKQEGKLEFLNATKDVAVSEVGGGSTGAYAFDKLAGPVIDSAMNSMRNGYSVEQESQADLRSMEICNGVGYDVKAFIGVLTRFKTTNSSYGGAKYPKDREGAAQGHVADLKGANETAVAEVRTARFLDVMKGI